MKIRLKYALFSHFNEKMFCFVCFFVAYYLPKTYHKPLPIYKHPPPKKKKKKENTEKKDINKETSQ